MTSISTHADMWGKQEGYGSTWTQRYNLQLISFYQNDLLYTCYIGKISAQIICRDYIMIIFK